MFAFFLHGGISVFAFCNCPQQQAVYTFEEDEFTLNSKGKNRQWSFFVSALIPIEHFCAVGANCCFDCFQFQLLATLGQIKDTHAATEPGN